MKKKFFAFIIVLSFLSGCSAYKELSPSPELIPKENGYINLKDGKSNFELERDTKYYMEITPPKKDNFYFVLKNNIKPISQYYFSDNFDGGDKGYNKIADVVSSEKSLSAFPVDSHHKKYYWIIEKIDKDTLLKAEYRYVPMWRFNFEREFYKAEKTYNKFALKRSAFKKTDYNEPLSSLKKKLSIVKVSIDSIGHLRKILPQMEKYFPDSLKTAKEKAYKEYLIFSNDVEEEYIFEKKNLSLLQTFTTLRETKNNRDAFIKSAPVYLNFLNSKLSIDESVKNKVRSIIAERISSVASEYRKKIKVKKDTKPFNIYPPVETIYKLYKDANGSVPENFNNLVNFFKTFDSKAAKFSEYKKYKNELKDYLAKSPKWLPNDYYAAAAEKLRKMTDVLPNVFLADFRGFENYYCVKTLQKELRNARRYTRKLSRDYREANLIVSRINNLRKRGAYGEMLSLLKANKEMKFLVNHYRFLDKKYLESEKNILGIYISSNNFADSERELKRLNNFGSFISPRNVEKEKSKLILNYEKELYSRVKYISKSRIDSFVNVHKLDTENLQQLYSDSVFTPVYRITFSYNGTEQVEKENREIENYLQKTKYFTFPEIAIVAQYRLLLRNINDNAVARVRAIEFHAKYYKGRKRKIRNIVDEFNMNIAKLITAPTDYRKLYVAPVTDKKKGVNKYMFKVSLKIPTKAKFPVYEINIKLPDEIANHASAEKWYDKIMLNNTELRNEGRIKIIAPTKDNNYECKITPVQMDAEEQNVLTVTFSFPSYKLYEVSVMAQKPIIRKN